MSIAGHELKVLGLRNHVHHLYHLPNDNLCTIDMLELKANMNKYKPYKASAIFYSIEPLLNLTMLCFIYHVVSVKFNIINKG